MTDASSLYGIAAELLVKSAAILAGTPAGAPTNQYVSQGAPPYDCCDTLTVHCGVLGYSPTTRGIPPGIVNPQMMVTPRVPLTVTALRCAKANPQGGVVITLPTPSQINTDAQTVYGDGWSLFCGLTKANRDKTLFAGYPCREFEIIGATPVSPEGGCLGWVVDCRVELDGFDPAGA